MTDTTDWKAEAERLRAAWRAQHDADSQELRRLCAARDAARRERDKLAARLAEIEAQVASAMTREDAALLCEEISSDLIAEMMRQGVDQDEARSLTASARFCASVIRSGYVAAQEPAAPAAAPERAEPAAPTCATNGLLGATSGVGRECDLWIGGACTSPHPCQHHQQAER